MQQQNLKHPITCRICCSLALTLAIGVFFDQASQAGNTALQPEKAIVQVFNHSQIF